MNSDCMRRPAEFSGYSRLRASAIALGRRQLVEDFRLLVLRQVLEDDDGVVGIELAHAFGHGLGRQLLEDLLADRVVDLGQRGEIEVRPISSTSRGRSSGSSASIRSPTSA